MHVIKARLESFRRQMGGYVIYLFKNLDEKITYELEYVMTVRFPNWNTPEITIGETGYLQYKEVFAGKDEWWDSQNEQFVKYKCTNIIFLDFIKEKPESTVTL